MLMLHLTLSIVVFIGFHALPSTPVRARLIERFGRRRFMWGFSALSVALLAWVGLAYSLADVDDVWWVTGPVVRLLSALVLLGAAFLLVAALTAERRVLLTAETVLRDMRSLRGVVRVTRHPLLWAVGIWGLVHMLNNADAPSWLFFGFMTLLALAGTLAIDRRRKRLLGEDWARVAETTSNLPFLAIARGHNRLVLSEIGIWRSALAVALWITLLALHGEVIGVPALWF